MNRRLGFSAWFCFLLGLHTTWCLKQVKEKLNGVDPYFTKLSESMVTWIEAWTEITNAAKESSSVGNGAAAKPVKK